MNKPSKTPKPRRPRKQHSATLCSIATVPVPSIDNLTREEIALLADYRKLSVEEQWFALGFMRRFSEDTPKKQEPANKTRLRLVVGGKAQPGATA